MIISGDALYAYESVMKICKKNKWEYIIRFKEDRIKSLGKEEIKYWNRIKYEKLQIEKETNVIKYHEKRKKKQ